MRETGPVSKVLQADGGGDSDAAKPYIGPARTALGVLKNQMRFNHLDQGSLTQRLPDGAVIKVTSRFGQDKMQILVPTPGETSSELTEPEIPQPEEPEWKPEELSEVLETDQYAVCGYGTFDRPGFSSGNAHAWVWKPGDTEVTEIPGPAGARSWFATAISGNGRVVVGAWIDETTGVQRAYKWSAAGGAEDLGAPYMADDAPNCAATSVNQDGTVIVGFGPRDNDANNGCCWVYAGGGMEILANSGTNLVGGVQPKVSVSPNGKYIFGTMFENMITSYTLRGSGPTLSSAPFYWLPGYSDVPRGALWTGSAGGGYAGEKLPLASTVRTSVTKTVSPPGIFPGPITYQSRYSIVEGEVANNGTVCGQAPYAAFCKLGGQVEFITPPGSTGYPELPEGEGTFTASPDGENTTAVAITGDGGRIVGMQGNAVGSFIWTRGNLVRDTPTDVNQVNGMSYDGTRYCGQLAFSIGTDGSTTGALYWAKGREQRIPDMADAIDTIATDVASATVRLPPLPPAPLPRGLELAGPGT